jgi:hypothetical protein
VEALPADSSARIPVSWTGQDNAGGTGVSFFDVYVSIDGGGFLLWQKETLDRSSVYQGALGRSYAFYSVATDVAGNREDPPLTADARTTVTRINHAPTLEPILDRVVLEGDTLIIQPVATDPDGDSLIYTLNTNAPPGVVVHPYTGRITWVTGEGSGPSTNRLTLQVLDTGSPRLGAVGSFTITVSDVNSAPVLDPISSRTIREGFLLVITNRARDFDLPAQRLTFSLGSGAPAGATLDAQTGVFSWQPADFQGGTTNPIRIIVTDAGTPSLSSTQAFTLVVRDTRSDFLAGFGTTNVLAGQSATVPLVLNAAADLTQISFELEAPDAHLAALTLTPASPEILSLALDPIGDSLYRVRIDLDPTQAQSGQRSLAQLTFDTALVGRSSIASLRIVGLSGVRLGGEVLANATPIHGRLFVIESQPLLDAEGVSGTVLLLVGYAQPGTVVRLQRCTEIRGNITWIDEQTATIPGTFLRLDWTQDQGPAGYFRLVRP